MLGPGPSGAGLREAQSPPSSRVRPLSRPQKGLPRCICPQPLARCACPCPTSCGVTEAGPPSSAPSDRPPRQHPQAAPPDRPRGWQESQPGGRGSGHRRGRQPGPGCPVPLTAEPHEPLGSRVAVPRAGWVLGLMAEQLFQRLLGPLESSRAWSLLERAPAPRQPCGLRVGGAWPGWSSPRTQHPGSPLDPDSATLPPAQASCPPLAGPATQLPPGWFPRGYPLLLFLPSLDSLGPPQTPGPPLVLWVRTAPQDQGEPRGAQPPLPAGLTSAFFPRGSGRRVRLGAFIPAAARPVDSLGLQLSLSPPWHSSLALAAPRGSLALGHPHRLGRLGIGSAWPPGAPGGGGESRQGFCCHRGPPACGLTG